MRQNECAEHLKPKTVGFQRTGFRVLLLRVLYATRLEAEPLAAELLQLLEEIAVSKGSRPPGISFPGIPFAD